MAFWPKVYRMFVCNFVNRQVRYLIECMTNAASNLVYGQREIFQQLRVTILAGLLTVLAAFCMGWIASPSKSGYFD